MLRADLTENNLAELAQLLNASSATGNLLVQGPWEGNVLFHKGWPVWARLEKPKRVEGKPALALLLALREGRALFQPEAGCQAPASLTPLDTLEVLETVQLVSPLVALRNLAVVSASIWEETPFEGRKVEELLLEEPELATRTLQTLLHEGLVFLAQPVDLETYTVYGAAEARTTLLTPWVKVRGFWLPAAYHPGLEGKLGLTPEKLKCLGLRRGERVRVYVPVVTGSVSPSWREEAFPDVPA